MSTHNLCLAVLLRGVDTVSGETTWSKLFCLPSEKWSTLKEKNLLPLGANSYLLGKTSSGGAWRAGKQT